MFRTTLNRVPVRASSRWIHTVPRLANQTALESQGVPGLFSPNAFSIAWTKYQKHLLDKLTTLTVDTDNETRKPFHILLNTAEKANQAHVFNYASQAHNNHAFFESLVSAENNETTPSNQLKQRIDSSFGSLENLRSIMLQAAEGLSGNGWVFLIEAADKNLYVMTCYNAGSPYTAGRAQVVDLNGPTDQDVLHTIKELQDAVLAKEKNFNIVLLAANVWEHAYLEDYGVAGKSQYLDNWWKSIHWGVVSSRLFSR